MGTTLNKRTFQNLVDGNLEWLLEQPQSCERDHIEAILKRCPEHYYDEQWKIEALQSQLAKQQKVIEAKDEGFDDITLMVENLNDIWDIQSRAEEARAINIDNVEVE